MDVHHNANTIGRSKAGSSISLRSSRLGHYPGAGLTMVQGTTPSPSDHARSVSPSLPSPSKEFPHPRYDQDRIRDRDYHDGVVRSDWPGGVERSPPVTTSGSEKKAPLLSPDQYLSGHDRLYAEPDSDKHSDDDGPTSHSGLGQRRPLGSEEGLVFTRSPPPPYPSSCALPDGHDGPELSSSHSIPEESHSLSISVAFGPGIGDGRDDGRYNGSMSVGGGGSGGRALVNVPPGEGRSRLLVEPGLGKMKWFSNMIRPLYNGAPHSTSPSHISPPIPTPKPKSSFSRKPPISPDPPNTSPRQSSLVTSRKIFILFLLCVLVSVVCTFVFGSWENTNEIDHLVEEMVDAGVPVSGEDTIDRVDILEGDRSVAGHLGAPGGVSGLRAKLAKHKNQPPSLDSHIRPEQAHRDTKSDAKSFRGGRTKAKVLKEVDAGKKDGSSKGWGRGRRVHDLVPLSHPGDVPRRYRYGANFIQSSSSEPNPNGVSAEDEPQEDEQPQTTDNRKKTSAQLSDHKIEYQRMLEKAAMRYRDEEFYWRNEYEWRPPGVHESLDDFVARMLDENEIGMREWIRETRINRGRGAPVGLASKRGAGSSPSILLPDQLEDESAAGSDGLNGAGSPLSFFFGGSFQKWADLLQEEASDVVLSSGAHIENQSCDVNGWMESYRNLHEEIVNGEREPRLITYICEQGMNCGGLGDRLLGMTSAFFFALITKRAFHAEWMSPIPLEIVFDSPAIDWSYSSFSSSSSFPDLASPAIFQNETLAREARDLDIIHFGRSAMDVTFGGRDWDAPVGQRLTPGLEGRDVAFASPWIKFYSNRGMIYRSFQYRRLGKRLEELGLKPFSAFSCILHYLFRPKPAALDFITQYTSVLSLPTVFSVGIQIRTGDASMKDVQHDRMNTVDVFQSYFKCAAELAETYSIPDQKVVYFLVTDSEHLREDAMRVYGSKVLVSGLGIEHIHVKKGHADGVHNAVVEEWILAKTDFRVITQDSGFGKLASFASAKPGRTVAVFPERGARSRNRKSQSRLDCRLESALTTFSELADEWSLG